MGLPSTQCQDYWDQRNWVSAAAALVVNVLGPEKGEGQVGHLHPVFFSAFFTIHAELTRVCFFSEDSIPTNYFESLLNLLKIPKG